MRVMLKLSEDGRVFEEEATIKGNMDSSPAVLLAAATKVLAERNKNSPSWNPKVVLLSVVRIPTRKAG